MYLYLVTVTSESPSVLDSVKLRLAAHVKESDRLQFSGSAWLVYSPNWPNWLRNALSPALADGDQLFIGSLTQPFDGILDAQTVRWINARLDSFTTAPLNTRTEKHAAFH